MADVEIALRKTRDNLASFYKLMSNGMLPVDEIDFVPVLPHLLAATYACAYFYVITADSGKALLVDFGAPNGALFSPVTHHFEGQRLSLHAVFTDEATAPLMRPLIFASSSMKNPEPTVAWIRRLSASLGGRKMGGS